MSGADVSRCSMTRPCCRARTERYLAVAGKRPDPGDDSGGGPLRRPPRRPEGHDLRDTSACPCPTTSPTSTTRAADIRCCGARHRRRRHAVRRARLQRHGRMGSRPVAARPRAVPLPAPAVAEVPSEYVIRDVLVRVDPDQLDRALRRSTPPAAAPTTPSPSTARPCATPSMPTPTRRRPRPAATTLSPPPARSARTSARSTSSSPSASAAAPPSPKKSRPPSGRRRRRDQAHQRDRNRSCSNASNSTSPARPSPPTP